MDSRFLDIDAAAKGTCEWLLRHETYTRWSSCDRGLLWIKGKPGSGKSTLLRNVLNDATPRLKTGEGALILKFFFHGRGTKLQKAPSGLFRSLHHQLLRQVSEALTDLVATFQQRCETVGKPGEKWQWHPRELPRLFESSLLKVLRTRPVWLFVDALDECGQKNAVRLVREFKSLLQGLPSTGSQFHICFTCRHYPILDQACQLEICLEDENAQDISTYVRAQLSVSRELTASKIPDLIAKHAQGVFIWARLVVDRIVDLDNGGAGLKKIEDEIYSIPPDLDDLYHDLIRNVDERSASLKLIQWICFTMRPLSLDELRWAMIVDADYPHKSLLECKSTKDYIADSGRMKRRVQTLSCGLAEVTSDTKVVQFIHQSVKDFFVQKGLSALDENAKPDFVVGSAHHRLSRTCIRYLAMEEIGRSANHKRNDMFFESHKGDDMISEFPFLYYATTSWVAHTKQSDARSVPQEDLLEYFAGPLTTLVERWVRIYRILERYSDDCPPEGTSLIHVMSRHGVVGALWAILKKADQVGINIDAKDSYGRTPLSSAAGNGHEAAVRLLLDRGAHIEAADMWGQTPLSSAAGNGHEAVVRLLLDRGAHTEAADIEGRTPLWWAVERGYEVVVRLLLDQGAHAEAADKDGWTPLWWAAAKGHEAVVRLLLDRGAHTEAADIEGRTLLWRATKNGHEAVVRLLLDRGAHTEAADEWGQTPLWRAAERGHEAIVRLLLDRGAHIEAADEWGQTPLSYATRRGHKAIVRLFLDRGAHIEAADEGGRTPLWRAAERGHEAIVRLFLDRGAHTDAADMDGWTPLWYAAGNGHEAVVRLFLDRGAHIEAADEGGQTPLSRAAAKGHEAVVRLLLDRGAHTDAADMWGSTSLLLAAANRHEAIVRLLLDRGAHTDAADMDGWTPLWTAENGHEAVVRLLLERGARTEAADIWGQTPLSRAAAKGHEAVVRLLQFHGAQPSSTTSP
ncbi:hypothetical protein NW759_017219 [Fusarium solani]|nr:hypothetical protein NW759_017219 [Fusarium solani]